MAYKKKAAGAMPVRSGAPKTGNPSTKPPADPKSIPADPGPKGIAGKAPVPTIPDRTGGDKTGPETRPTTPKPGMPKPVQKYASLKSALRTPGMQPGEADALQRISKNRGVSMMEAAAIGRRRTAKGLPTAQLKPNRPEPGRRDMAPKSAPVGKGKRLPKRIPGRGNPGPGPFNPKGSR